MGYTRRTYNITFVDPDMEGLEIKCRPMSVRQTVELMKLRSQFAPTGTTNDEDLAVINQMIDMLVAVLTSWNLEETDGTPVPCTAEMLQREGLRFVMAVLAGYLEAVMSIPPPLAGPSANGGPPPGLSLPMEVASPSPGSL